jgi:hypothetical protein
MYTSVDFTSQIIGQRGSLCPTNKEASYTNLVSSLVVTLKIDYYYLLLLTGNIKNQETSMIDQSIRPSIYGTKV